MAATLLSFSFFAANGIGDYLEIFKLREAMALGLCPKGDGGMFSMVRQPCTLDSACAPVCTLCSSSCPNTTIWASACINYIDITATAQYGTTIITPPVSFVYTGGGFMPKAGDEFLFCGLTGYVPLVIGIPGMTAKRIDKVIHWFDYIIAGSKDI